MRVCWMLTPVTSRDRFRRKKNTRDPTGGYGDGDTPVASGKLARPRAMSLPPRVCLRPCDSIILRSARPPEESPIYCIVFGMLVYLPHNKTISKDSSESPIREKEKKRTRSTNHPYFFVVTRFVITANKNGVDGSRRVGRDQPGSTRPTK